MNTTELLKAFENPQMIMSLSFTEKMSGVLITTVLGMGITFLALILIMYMINGLSCLLMEKKKEEKIVTAPTSVKVEDTEEEIEEDENENNEELVAAITAAISLQLGGNKKFVVTNIEKIQDKTPIWSKMGTMEQLSSRL